MADSLQIAVTGGGGRVGRWIVRGLLDRGHRVIVLDRQYEDDSRARFVQGDVRLREVVEPVLRDCDAVCHLADIPNADAPFPREEIYWGNARSASVVLQSAADLRLRHAIYASTCQVYGVWGQNAEPPARLPIDENTPVNPRNVYAVSKVANEIFARDLTRETGLSISIFRFPAVFPSEEFIERAVRHALADGRLGDGMSTYIHAQDVAAACAAALEISRPGCEIYNLGAADLVSVSPLADRLRRHHPDYPSLPAGWPERKSPLLCEKAEKLLNWRPTWSISDRLSARASRGERLTR